MRLERGVFPGAAEAEARMRFLKLSVVTLAFACALIATAAEARTDPITTYTDLASFEAASGFLKVVDFDEDASGDSISDGTVIADQYASWGVTFGPHVGGDLRADGHSGYAVSGPNLLLGGVPFSYGGGGYEIDFTQAVTQLGLWFGGLHGDRVPTTLTAFGTSGAVVGSFVAQDEVGFAPSGNLFFGLHSTAPIATVQVAIGTNDFVWLDDIMFGSTESPAVPEPGTLALLSLGLAGLLLRKRRRS